MHIVFVTTELATKDNSSGGLASFTANISRIFRENGHKVTIILSTIKETELEFDDDIDLINVYVPKMMWEFLDKVAGLVAFICKGNRIKIRSCLLSLCRSKRINSRIRKMDKRQKVDIVHYCNLASVAVCATRKIPYTIRVSGIENLWYGTYLPSGEFGYNLYPMTLPDRLNEYTMKKSRYIISPSNYVAEVVREHINSNVTVLESPFVFKRSNWNYDLYNRIGNGKKYIIHYGRLTFSKGTHVIAELSEQFLKEYPDMYIIIAGNNGDMQDTLGTPMKASELVIQSAGEYADRVIYLGKPVREELFPFIENAQVCVFPSRIENLANACIEAMAMGKLTVATDGFSFEQLIEDGVSGFLCQSNDKESFMHGIVKALELSEKAREQMCLNAQKSVEKLEPQKVYMNYLKYYEEIIRNW